MATSEVSCPVPAELSERFLAIEAPSFDVVRSLGDIRLWRSTTKAHQLHGFECASKVHYHVTTGDQADHLLMRDFGTAVANFEAVAAQQSKDGDVMSTGLSGHGFSEPAVILVRGNDERCGRYWDESAAGFEQAHDGPTHLVVGRLASDEKLQKLADRFGYSMSELNAFRDAGPAQSIGGES